MSNNESEFNFEVGDLVHHVRYGYRGVVFTREAKCTADENWYQSNQTQPSRDQPWYGVMVDGATHTTYVAQSNLVADVTGEPVEHPLVRRVFQSFYRVRYHRENLN